MRSLTLFSIVCAGWPLVACSPAGPHDGASDAEDASDTKEGSVSNDTGTPDGSNDTASTDGGADESVSIRPSDAAAGPIPTNLWGMHVNQPQDFPVQVPYGDFRFWDTNVAQWPQIETASGTFDWSGLDAELQELNHAGVNDVMYTLSRTPSWAVLPSQLNPDLGCNYGPGECFPPDDLNADGTGSNAIWKTWVTAIASHVNDAAYLNAGHAHIHIWEPWNEVHRSSVINDYDGGVDNFSYQGTYAQLVRMTEDLRCTITGNGAIHNFPTIGATVPCTSPPIDSEALITNPSVGMSNEQVLQNFLYCNNHPKSGSQCTTGSGGSQTVDVIDYHMYAIQDTPEDVAYEHLAAGRKFLSPADLAKPLIDGEGSWGSDSANNNSTSIWTTDSFARAGFIARTFSTYWSVGVSHIMWYSYDGWGMLFDHGTGKLVAPEATAWNTTHAWLAGATPLNSPFCIQSGTVFTCELALAGGGDGELVWDTRFGPQDGNPGPATCQNYNSPIVCGDEVYPVGQYANGWVDLSGESHPSTSATAIIGANPILLLR
jgi:hypothetical protein